MKLPELLSPAGDLERVQTALLYGADTVYLAGRLFGMRAKSVSFPDPCRPWRGTLASGHKPR